jgi:tRNA(fMet)-specific endonuclease VapC
MLAGKRKDALRTFLYETVAPTMPVLPFDARAGEIHAQERARLARRGPTPTFADGQIAAIALANELVLVTANVKDFARYRDLAVENWLNR